MDRTEAARRKLTDELYNRIDAGLGKRDAHGLVEAIEAFIDAKINDFDDLMRERDS